MMTVRVSELTREMNPDETEKLLILDEQRGAQGEGKAVSIEDVLGVGIQQMTFFVGISGVSANVLDVLGEVVTYDNNQTGDYSTAFSLGNNHLAILVVTVTTGGDIVITGTSVSESTAVPVASDTETLTIDDSTNQYYQTTKKWLTIDTIDVSGVPAINYAILGIGYMDFGNRNWELAGYRAEFLAESALSDIAIVIKKVQDDGNKKMSLVDLEDMGIDATAAGGEITDGIRTGDDDRSYTFSMKAWDNGAMFVFKQLDYNTYFSNLENKFHCIHDEGIHIHLQGSPSGGIAGVSHGTITIYYRMR